MFEAKSTNLQMLGLIRLHSQVTDAEANVQLDHTGN